MPDNEKEPTPVRLVGPDPTPRREEPFQLPTDGQVEVEAIGDLFEVLTQLPNGHRTVHRVRAWSRQEAEDAVAEQLGDGTVVVGVAGAGLGSGDHPREATHG